MKNSWTILVVSIALALVVFGIWVKQTLDKLCFNLKFGNLDTSNINANWGGTFSGTVGSTIKLNTLNKSNINLNVKVLSVVVLYQNNIIAEVNEPTEVNIAANSISQNVLPVLLSISSSSSSAIMSYFSGEDLPVSYKIKASFYGIPFTIYKDKTINKSDSQTQCI